MCFLLIVLKIFSFIVFVLGKLCIQQIQCTFIPTTMHTRHSCEYSCILFFFFWLILAFSTKALHLFIYLFSIQYYYLCAAVVAEETPKTIVYHIKTQVDHVFIQNCTMYFQKYASHLYNLILEDRKKKLYNSLFSIQSYILRGDTNKQIYYTILGICKIHKVYKIRFVD